MGQGVGHWVSSRRGLLEPPLEIHAPTPIACAHRARRTFSRPQCLRSRDAWRRPVWPARARFGKLSPGAPPTPFAAVLRRSCNRISASDVKYSWGPVAKRLPPVSLRHMGASGVRVTITEQWGAADLAELRELYEPLRRFAAVVGRWDVEPDDLVQEAYTRVLVRPPGCVRDMGPYLRRTIVNIATNERRRARRNLTLMRRVSEIDAVTTVDAYPSELEDLMRLDPEVRGLLYLVEVEGEPIALAAAVVGMTAPAARMALTRARRRLRAELGSESDDA